MKITKYEHSFILLEQNGQQLILDPGTFTSALPKLHNVVGIIVTHEHSDHLSTEHLRTIAAAYPNTPLYAPQDVLSQLEDVDTTKVTAEAGATVTLGAFTIKFTGGNHAPIYKTSPCENVGVLVNSSFYTPGDSLDKPGAPVGILALPVSAPWLKTSEAMDYISETQPKTVMPVHDMLLSEIGKTVTYRWLKQATDDVGADWRVIQSGQSIDIQDTVI